MNPYDQDLRKEYLNLDDILNFSAYVYVYRHFHISSFKGQLGVPLTVYPWYLLRSTLGFLGIITDKYPRDIGLIVRAFPWRGPPLGSGAPIQRTPLNHGSQASWDPIIWY